MNNTKVLLKYVITKIFTYTCTSFLSGYGNTCNMNFKLSSSILLGKAAFDWIMHRYVQLSIWNQLTCKNVSRWSFRVVCITSYKVFNNDLNKLKVSISIGFWVELDIFNFQAFWKVRYFNVCGREGSTNSIICHVSKVFLSFILCYFCIIEKIWFIRCCWLLFIFTNKLLLVFLYWKRQSDIYNAN